jgi:drug/metabolite transporter (DMT)-like permease
VAHSLLFLRSDPVILVIGYLVAMKKLRRNDAIGVMIAMIGMVLASFDYSRSHSSCYGDLIELAGCASAVVYLLIGKQALDTHKFPLWSYLILLNGSGSLFSWLISGIFYGIGTIFDL